MIVVSVVRDFELYERLVKNNSNYADAKFVSFDNSKENLTIPQRYNSFLNAYDYSKPDWFVFCHEDWKLCEQLTFPSKDAIYGVIGVN